MIKTSTGKQGGFFAMSNNSVARCFALIAVSGVRPATFFVNEATNLKKERRSTLKVEELRAHMELVSSKAFEEALIAVDGKLSKAITNALSIAKLPFPTMDSGFSERYAQGKLTDSMFADNPSDTPEVRMVKKETRELLASLHSANRALHMTKANFV